MTRHFFLFCRIINLTLKRHLKPSKKKNRNYCQQNRDGWIVGTCPWKKLNNFSKNVKNIVLIICDKKTMEDRHIFCIYDNKLLTIFIFSRPDENVHVL